MSRIRLSRRRVLRPCASAIALAVAGIAPLHAQEAAAPAGAAGGFTPTFETSIEAVETRSRRDPAENGVEGVVTLTPGLRYASRTGTVRGFVDYRATLTARRGIEAVAGNEVRNGLDASLTADAVPGRFSVDLRAGISQQTLSPYGEQVTEGSARRTDNRTEVRTVTVAPRLRGPIYSFAEYDLTADASVTRSGRAEGTDSNARGAAFSLVSPAAAGPAGWRLAARERRVEYEDRPSVTERSAIGGLTVRLPDNARIELRGGRESVYEDGVATIDQGRTVGAGLAWAPSPRASFSADLDDRYFGRAGRATLSYRLPRTVITYAFVKDTSGGADARSTLGATTLYDLLYAAAAGAYPDPAQRDAAVRELLRSRGLDGSAALPAGFQTSALSVVRRQEMSAVWTGVRTTLSVSGFTTSTSELLFVPGVDPVIGEPERQHGYAATLAYRLTPTTSLLAAGSRLMAKPTSTEAGNDLKSASIALSDRLGRRTTASLAASYTVFNSPTLPYRETSLIGTIALVF